MTAQERADLAVLQDQMKRSRDDVTEIKRDVKAILEQIGQLDSRYVTRDEMRLGKWVIGSFIAAAGAVGAVVLAWRK